jgi:hypothetical protein
MSRPVGCHIAHRPVAHTTLFAHNYPGTLTTNHLKPQPLSYEANGTRPTHPLVFQHAPFEQRRPSMASHTIQPVPPHPTTSVLPFLLHGCGLRRFRRPADTLRDPRGLDRSPRRSGWFLTESTPITRLTMKTTGRREHLSVVLRGSHFCLTLALAELARCAVLVWLGFSGG